MKTSLRSLTLALTLAASVLGAAAAQAQNVNVTGSVVTALPAVIAVPGNYVLNNNLNYAGTATSGSLIAITASNVTLDFQSRYIAGIVNNTSQTIQGISVNEQSNVTIKNGTVAYCQYGIVMQGNGNGNTNAVDAQIDHMRVTYCYNSGIYIVSCPACRITNRQVSLTGYSGAGGAGAIYNVSGGATIANCVISTVTASASFGVAAGAGCYIRGCTISNCVTGISGGKYQDNLFYNCTTTITGGTDAGGNN